MDWSNNLLLDHMFACQIEAIMNDFIQLTPVSNVYEAETMVEGQLVFFTFFRVKLISLSACSSTVCLVN